LFRKPFNGTVATNVLQWGTGGINVDGCRVGWNPDDRIAYEKKRRSFSSEEGKITNGCFNASPMISSEEKIKNSQLGRFPANFILSYPEDEYMLREDVKPEQLIELGEWLNENA
jgi:site-specific DNA-methyltransferase (adenine-specific)